MRNFDFSAQLVAPGVSIECSDTRHVLLKLCDLARQIFEMLHIVVVEIIALGDDLVSVLVLAHADAGVVFAISYEDLEIIRQMWPGKIVIKGLQNVADSKKLIDLGVDGIVLSNHGGRQLDRAPVPFHLLPQVVREVGKDATIMVDTGIMNGADIVASIALGAKFTLIGRAYLYGLMAGGRAGVDKTIDILRTELTRTMALLGVSSLEELEPRHVTQLQRMTPIAAPAARTAPRTRSTASKAGAKA